MSALTFCSELYDTEQGYIRQKYFGGVLRLGAAAQLRARLWDSPRALSGLAAEQL